MSAITTDLALNFTKDLDILYVEDELELQEQTKEFFEVLFQSVIVADDGEKALKIYKKQAFDIVITDIKMPNMDGVTLSKEIRKINPMQDIIIVSAYADNEYLLEFINLNIRQFITKPTNIDNMIETLYFTSKNIVNAKMIQEYREGLESANEELTTKNRELQSLVRILDAKLVQIAKENTKTKRQELDSTKATISNEYLNELKEIEVDISGAAVLISLSKNLNISNIEVLGAMFSSYSNILKNYEVYNELMLKTDELGLALSNAPENFIKRVGNISVLLESFIYVLRMWRNNIVEKKFNKAFELHSSMINDINTIIAIIDGTEDEIETEMEFF